MPCGDAIAIFTLIYWDMQSKVKLRTVKATWSDPIPRLSPDLHMNMVVVARRPAALEADERRGHAEARREIRLDEHPLDVELRSVRDQPAQRSACSFRLERPVGIEPLQRRHVPA